MGILERLGAIEGGVLGKLLLPTVIGPGDGLGLRLGESDDTIVGNALGCELGERLGTVDGTILGTTEGISVGIELGVLLGMQLGMVEGRPLGWRLRFTEGVNVGFVLWRKVDGFMLGNSLLNREGTVLVLR